MSVTIGSLVVSLSTKTTAWRKGLAGAGRNVSSLVSKVGGGIKNVTKIGAAMGAAAIGGIALFTKRSFASIDATAKLARQIGIEIDQLRGLKHAAEITGAGQESLVKGLGFLSKALGEAKTGIGEGKQALESLGLSADELAEMPVDQAVGQIADEMNKLTTQSEKAFVASKLFGRGGLALVNTLALGSKGLQEMTEGTIRLQGGLSAIDAAKVESANDAVSDLGISWKGLFERIAVSVAPAVQSIAEFATKGTLWIRDMLSTTGPSIVKWVKGMVMNFVSFGEGVIDSIRQIPDAIRFMVIQAFRMWKIGIGKLTTEWKTFAAILSTGWEGIGTLVADIWDQVKKSFLDSISFIGDKIVSIAKFIVDKLPGENKWIKDMISGYESGLGAVDSLAGDIADRSSDRWAKFWKEQEGARTGLTSDLDALNKELTMLDKVLSDQAAGVLSGRGGGGGLADTVRGIMAEIQNIELPTVAEAFKEGGKVVGDSMKNAVKAIGAPAAIERGTVEAYSATVRQAYKSLADNGKRTVDQLKLGNRLTRTMNRNIEKLAGQTVTMEVG